MRAKYDLSKYLTSFNFFEWLLMAHARGATRVSFAHTRFPRSDKWTNEIARQRYESICKPGPALISLPYDELGIGDDIAKPGGNQLVSFWKDGGRFKRLESPTPAIKDHRYTVTLRSTQRDAGRNSDDAVWRAFAAEIGALVIEDYDTKPMHLHRRMAIYAGAEMNLFISNGPALLCSFSPYPCMIFSTRYARGRLLKDGMGDGEQYPWMLAGQRTIWEFATAESLRRHFYHWRDTGTWADDSYLKEIANGQAS